MTTLKPEQITALIDSREQLPFDLAPLRTERASLATGDYSVKGLEDVIAIERKSLPDLLGCCGQHRDRFERELQRLLAYPVRAVVVEAGWADIDAGQWRSKLKPQQVSGSIAGWIAKGIPFAMLGNKDRATEITRQILCVTACRRLRECETLLNCRRQPARN